MEEQEDITLAMARDTLHKGMMENKKASHSVGQQNGQKEHGPRHGTCGECGRWVLKMGMKRVVSKSGQLIFVCPDCYEPSDVQSKRFPEKLSKRPYHRKKHYDVDITVIDVIKAADHYKECLSGCGVTFHMIGNATVKCIGCGSTFRFSKGV